MGPVEPLRPQVVSGRPELSRLGARAAAGPGGQPFVFACISRALAFCARLHAPRPAARECTSKRSGRRRTDFRLCAHARAPV